ncbi:MAG: hypothetical protein WCE54_23510 [Ignavibacteriaceae bacterium]
MKYFSCCFILILLINASNQAQEKKIQFEFLPPGLNFAPLKANMQEAKTGVLFFPDNKNLKVDMGNNADLLKLNFLNDNISLAAAIEFLGYALSTDYKEYRLQIDALDGFFGGNITFKKKFKRSELAVRLRIIHNSAHLVDGHYDFIRKFWINNDSSIHYTRNFYELTIAHQVKTNFGYFRYYGGGSYSFFVRPSNIKRINALAGFEIDLENLLGKVLKKDENIFFAEHFSLAGFHEYVGSQQAMLGIKFGAWEGKGLTLYLSYYTGLNFFNTYYGAKISKFGTGFYVDFP